MTEKEKTALVSITVIEGRHYIWPNMNSAVIVKVDHKKRCTAVHKKSDSPFYNEYFVFELHDTYDQILEKTITFTVVQPKTFCQKRKILGTAKLDIATVFHQKNNQFYHKWAVLTSPKLDSSGPTGYLKLDIAVLSRGQTPKLPTNVVNDEIEGNLLTSTGLLPERQRAQFIFEIYKCENLQTKSSHFIDSTSTRTNNAAMDIRPSTYIEINFAGITINTSVKKHTQTPIFNEKLIITDLFPPLCQRIKIDICFEGLKKTIHSSHYLNLISISSDSEEGFLPTFGPTYIHTYSKQNLEGYAGTVLMSMYTDILDTETAICPIQSIRTIGINPIMEEEMFNFQDTFLLAAIFDANFISKKFNNKKIIFRMTFGNITYETDVDGAKGDGYAANVSEPMKPSRSGKSSFYMNYEGEKPCLHIKSRWPDFRKRMFNSNMLESVFDNLTIRLNSIEHLFLNTNAPTSDLISEKLTETLDFLLANAAKYIEILSTNYDLNYGTVLDKERVKLCISVLKSIVEKVKQISTNKSKKFVFRKLQNIQKKIESLIEDPQHCWPDIFIWMTNADRKIAYLRVPARSIIFSHIPEEMGKNCAKIRPELFVLKDTIFCKVDILFWLGLDSQLENCFNMLPAGFKYNGRLLISEEKHLFEGRAYIFKGEIQPGHERSGLCDPFVQVVLSKESKTTSIKRKSVMPIWDQTLIFHNISIYGSKEHIKENPPNLLVQMFDDEQCKRQLVGRDIIQATAGFIDELGKCNEDHDNLLLGRIISLKSYPLYNHGEEMAKLLAAFDIVEISQLTEIVEPETLEPIPMQIKPILIPYRIEILFWGVRHMKKINLIRINRPRLTFYCASKYIQTNTIENARRHANFSNYIQSLDVTLPNQLKHYAESFQLKLFDSRKFGIYIYAGVNISNLAAFLFVPMTADERKMIIKQQPCSADSESLNRSDLTFNIDIDNEIVTDIKKKKRNFCFNLFTNFFARKRLINAIKKQDKKSEYSLLSFDEQDDYDDMDWWSKFYASEKNYSEISHKNSRIRTGKPRLKIYKNELEHQPEFGEFADMLTKFEIYKGKRTGDETLDEENVTAIFKGAVKLYRWPPEAGDKNEYVLPNGFTVADGVFTGYPENTALAYLLRVYIVRGLNLRPRDMASGKSDPYIALKLGNRSFIDRENYIPNQVNPLFGRTFEIHAIFPEDHTLTVKVFDRDICSDNLIGETVIDLENRFYTKHRASCGIAEIYDACGPYRWRDPQKPTVILSGLCKKWGLEMPVYKNPSVSIGSTEFRADGFKSTQNPQYDKEILALSTLRQWSKMPLIGFKLVPEHVETRSLFLPDKPGIEQGKIQLWIDMFQLGELPVPEQIDINPRKSVKYEFRVIIWNTEDVLLEEDDLFTGEKKSDIYVKGWIDESTNCQFTDVHYRSLTGEGNFNWRFIFPINYLSSEKKIVIYRKENILAKEETEIKLPCVLHLTIWDNDTFSKDDFIGCLNLELPRFPRGARTAKNCNLELIKSSPKRLNLFKIRRTKGWWPLLSFNKISQKETMVGKIEIELELLTLDEAILSPAGLGRQGPQALPPPKRPDISFFWLTNPLKSLKFMICNRWKWKAIGCFCCVFFIIFGLLMIYTFPGVLVQKLLGV